MSYLAKNKYFSQKSFDFNILQGLHPGKMLIIIDLLTKYPTPPGGG